VSPTRANTESQTDRNHCATEVHLQSNPNYIFFLQGVRENAVTLSQFFHKSASWNFLVFRTTVRGSCIKFSPQDKPTNHSLHTMHQKLRQFFTFWRRYISVTKGAGKKKIHFVFSRQLSVRLLHADNTLMCAYDDRRHMQVKFRVQMARKLQKFPRRELAFFAAQITMQNSNCRTPYRTKGCTILLFITHFIGANRNNTTRRTVNGR